MPPSCVAAGGMAWFGKRSEGNAIVILTPLWMTAAEHSWLSKWNHGDAVALQEIADRLKTAGDDLWVAINAIEEGDGLALRSIVHMLRILYALTGLFGASQTPVDELSARHAALAAEFHARVPAHLRSKAPAESNGGSDG